MRAEINFKRIVHSSLNKEFIPCKNMVPAYPGLRSYWKLTRPLGDGNPKGLAHDTSGFTPEEHLHRYAVSPG